MQSQEELHFTLDQLKESTPKGMSKTPKSKKKTWGGGRRRRWEFSSPQAAAKAGWPLIKNS